MTDHKFTDDDVIKALECCRGQGCKECPFNCNCATCIMTLQDSALALINRQKRVIERLQADIDGAYVFLEEQNKKRTQEHKIQMEMLNKLQEQIPLTIARAKSEAIKEFAERVKSDLGRIPLYQFTRSQVEWSINTITDKIIKEVDNG